MAGRLGGGVLGVGGRFPSYSCYSMFAYQTINQQTSLEQDLSVVSLRLCIRGCPPIIPFLPIINDMYHGLNILVHVILVIEVLL